MAAHSINNGAIKIMFVSQKTFNSMVNERDFWRNLYEKCDTRSERDRHYYDKNMQELKDKIELLYSDELENSEFEFDFNAVDAFSVERVNNNGRNATLIGYMLIEGEKKHVKEWTLYCSLVQHQKLVDQFKTHIKNKSNT